MKREKQIAVVLAAAMTVASTSITWAHEDEALEDLWIAQEQSEDFDKDGTPVCDVNAPPGSTLRPLFWHRLSNPGMPGRDFIGAYCAGRWLCYVAYGTSGLGLSCTPRPR